MVIISEEMHKKIDEEVKKFPPEIVERWAKAIHKAYSDDEEENKENYNE